MTAPIVKVYSTTSDKINSLNIVDGQLIFVSDLQTIYLDLNGKRLHYNIIQTISSHTERLKIKYPPHGFYYIEEDNSMWRYKDKWTQITEGNALHFIFQEDIQNFPSLGDSRFLYATNNGIYRWNQTEKTYMCISNKTSWEEIGK